MKRIATSITALAVAGAMSLAVLPAAQAESTTNGSSYSYSIEGIAGSLQQFAKLSPELQAEIRAAIQAQDLVKLIQLKLRVDAELAKIEAAEQGKVATDAQANSGSSALSSVISDGLTNNKKESTQGTPAAPAPAAGGNAKAEAGSSVNKVVEDVTAGSSTKSDTTNAGGEASLSDKITAGSSINETTETTETKGKGGLSWEAVLGFGSLALAALSFGSMLSSDNGGSKVTNGGSSAGSSDALNSSSKRDSKEEKPKQENKDKEDKSKLGGEVAAKGKDQKGGEVAAKGKRGVLAATGDNTAARAVAGLLLALIAVAGFVARRKLVK